MVDDQLTLRAKLTFGQMCAADNKMVGKTRDFLIG